MQATESCSSPEGSLYPCYRCIHSCKLQEQCYEDDAWLGSMPKLFGHYLSVAYYAFASPLCWVMDEPCQCVTKEAARRASACIRSCSYTCPEILHNVKNRFVDCRSSSPGAM